MASSTKQQDERAAQQAAADTLQKQIDALVGGKASPGSRPASFRDFVNEKMAEHTTPPKKSRSRR